ncbi:MAG: cell envelope integrity protein TolA [Thermoanaerobaculia bacterium]
MELTRDSLQQKHDQHQAAIRAIRESEFKHANPGAYKCPECLYVTLNLGASRCPTCHAVIGPDHWKVIYSALGAQADERERKERVAAEEWAKGEPERQRLAKAAAEVKERAKLGAERAAKAERFARFYFSYLLPIASAGSAMIVLLVASSEKYRGIHLKWDHLVFLVPVVNWLFYSLMLFGSERKVSWVVLILWAAVGYFVFAIVRRGGFFRETG